MNDDSGIVLAEELRASLGEFVRVVRTIADDLSTSALDALRSLDGEPQTVAELARSRLVKHQSMSATVADLEERGFVVRERDATDGRVWRVSVTREGKAALERGRSARATVIAAALSDLPPADRRALASVPRLLQELTSAVARRS
ncbi:MAG: MarR family transcriptional regulator [Frondihabitans sp.]|nr:MarR family transcriptional regulator [Frondihabitans sp.]